MKIGENRRSFFQKLFGGAVSVAAVAAMPTQAWAKVEQIETLKVKKDQRYLVRMRGNWPPNNLEQMQAYLKTQGIDCIVVDDGLADIFVLPT